METNIKSAETLFGVNSMWLNNSTIKREDILTIYWTWKVWTNDCWSIRICNCPSVHAGLKFKSISGARAGNLFFRSSNLPIHPAQGSPPPACPHSPEHSCSSSRPPWLGTSHLGHQWMGDTCAWHQAPGTHEAMMNLNYFYTGKASAHCLQDVEILEMY